MSVKAKCPKCGRVLNISADLFGKTADCPGCGAKIRVPTPASAASPGPQPAPAPAAPAVSQPAVAAGGPPPLPAAGGAPAAQSLQVDVSGPPDLQTEPGAGSVSARLRRKSQLNPAVIAGGIAVVGFLAVMGVALSLMGGGSPDSMRFLPSDSMGVAVINLAQMRESSLYRDMVAKNPKLAQMTEDSADELGIQPDDINRILVGGGENDRDPVIVVELSRAVDPEQFLQEQRPSRTWQKETVGDATIHVAGLRAFHFPTEYTVVGGRADAIRRALDPNRQSGFSTGLAPLVADLDYSQAVAVAFVKPASTGDLPVDVPVQLVEKIKGMTFHLGVGSDLDLDAVLHCNDSQTAEEIQKMVDGWLVTAKNLAQVPAEAREVIESISISRSGRTVRGRVRVTGEQIDRFSEQMPGMTPL